jgi:ABC-2 type transport system ATP-binding protein
VDGVDLRVPVATAFGFLGPNGAGKTTLIRTVLGLTRPSSGSWSILGHSMPRESAIALRRVGAIVEEPRFHPHLTGRENLRIIAAAREPAADGRIPAALERVGLSARADERVAKYSMGMRQRLGVARCLLADPQLLILDEPMNGLDPAGIQEFREMVANLVLEGRTVLLSSHLLDEVEKTCEQVAIIDRGRILMQGTVSDIGRTGKPTVRIRCGDLETASTVIPLVHDVQKLTLEGDSVVVTLGTEPGVDVDNAVAEMNRRLVEASVPVYGIEAERVSLEERFLEMTSRLEEGA